MLKRSTLSTTAFIIHLFSCALLAQAMGCQAEEVISRKFLVPSIVKVEVSFVKSKIVAGTETCKSEGTGFIIDRRHIITANHVLDFDPECGPAQIFAKSYYPKSSSIDASSGSEWHFNFVDRIDDVALLSTDQAVEMDLRGVPEDKVLPCAIPVGSNDVTNRKAIKYGIPKGRRSVVPIEVDVYDESESYPPLIEFGPTEVFGGESGGPIVSDYQVVGIMRQKLTEVTTLNFMSRGSVVNRLLNNNNIKVNYSDVCTIYNGLIQKADILRTPYGAYKGIIFLAPPGGPPINQTGILSAGELDNALRTAIESGVSLNIDATVTMTAGGLPGTVGFEIAAPAPTIVDAKKIEAIENSIRDSYSLLYFRLLEKEYDQTE